MKVLLVTNYLPPKIGGIEMFSHELASEIQKMDDVEITVASAKWFSTSDDNYNSQNDYPYKVVFFPSMNFFGRLPLPKVFHISFWNKIGNLPTDFDLVIFQSHLFILNWITAYRFRRVPRRLWINHGCNYVPVNSFVGSLLSRLYERAGMTIMKSLCNELVAQSRNAALWISSQVGAPFLVINNSINLQRFRREKMAISGVPRTKVLFVGRLVEGKGLYQCIQAVQKANEMLVESANFPPFSLTIVGSGPLSKQVNESSFNFEVSYLGEMSHSQVIEQMFHADILIQAYSQPEGMTTVTLEGLAAGLIIVTTPLGGSNHFKDCQNFLSDEIRFLPDLLLRAREIKASRESFIIQGLQIIESEFTWNLTAERILKKRFFDYRNFN